ncbi:MAG TPA: hypothetical protein VEW07_04915, partial [Solirubrobacterales bacterium]|nr:hypothetical protein [Solirubrobacterales bacterium]
MKTTAYLRVGKPKGGRAPKLAVNAKPNLRPLEDDRGRVLPTTSFAIELEIPDEAFTSAAH